MQSDVKNLIYKNGGVAAARRYTRQRGRAITVYYPAYWAIPTKKANSPTWCPSEFKQKRQRWIQPSGKKILFVFEGYGRCSFTEIWWADMEAEFILSNQRLSLSTYEQASFAVLCGSIAADECACAASTKAACRALVYLVALATVRPQPCTRSHLSYTSLISLDLL